jgi:hypothetical protein
MGKSAQMVIRYRGRGLDSFVYHLDPALRAQDVHLTIAVTGGDHFDYPERVLAASQSETRASGFTLRWGFPSLESGVALGVILPSQKTFDTWIATMARRSVAPFCGFLVALAVFGLRAGRPLLFYECYLLAAIYGFFFVLLAYLAAFTNFYFAYLVCVVGLGAAVLIYLWRLFPGESPRHLALVWISTMVVPTLAVTLEGYTGLIYTLEILGLLLAAMTLSTREGVRAFVAQLLEPEGEALAVEGK